MLVGTQQRKARNSTKVNLVISLVFHGALVLGALYFAARSGYLGDTIRTITLNPVEKEKPKPEPVKPKPVEPPKTTEPKMAEVIKPEITTAPPKSTAPPPDSSPTLVAPPAAEPPSFDFGGGKDVLATSDLRESYKQSLQRAIQINWNRPEGMEDHSNVAEVEINVDKTGKISNPVFTKKTGQSKWDDSVRLAILSTGQVGPPPSNFPSQVTVKFDVEEKDAGAP